MSGVLGFRGGLTFECKTDCALASPCPVRLGQLVVSRRWMPAPHLDAFVWFGVFPVFCSTSWGGGAKLVSQETFATGCSQFTQTQL